MISSHLPSRVARRLGLVSGLVVCALVCAPSALASPTATVDLGTAAGYGIISGASVANTGNTTVRGDLGASTAPSGFAPPGVVTGAINVGSADTTAYNDMLAAYSEVQGRTGGAPLPALAGVTLTPGLYSSGAAASLAAAQSAAPSRSGRRRSSRGRCSPPPRRRSAPAAWSTAGCSPRPGSRRTTTSSTAPRRR